MRFERVSGRTIHEAFIDRDTHSRYYNLRHDSCFYDLGGIFLLNVRVSREDDNAHGIAVGLAFSARPNAYQGEIEKAFVIYREWIHPETRGVDHSRYVCAVGLKTEYVSYYDSIYFITHGPDTSYGNRRTLAVRASWCTEDIRERLSPFPFLRRAD